MNFEPFTFVLERVGQLLVDEVKILSTDTKKLLESLQQQLELAQSFVKDVEEEKEKAKISNVLETEFQHIMQILPQIEDFLDTLYLEDVQEMQQPISIQRVMAYLSHSSNPLVQRYVVNNTANKLIGDLGDTRKRAEPYQRQSNHQVIPIRRSPTQPNIMSEEFIVGLDGDVKTLVAKLKGVDGDHTTILAIAGMAGSGKSTLTRKLYNHQEIKRHFQGCLAWVCVSQEWDASQLLRDICVQFHIPITESELSMAGFKLQEFLQTSSCLVVLDDVWGKKALQELLPSLLPAGGGMEENCRVLITTRNEDILHDPTQGGVYIHKARTLTRKQSWELFSKIIRNKWEGKRDFDEESEFAKLGKIMLKGCHGLPLAIVALAGLLHTKGTIREWSALQKRVSSTILRRDKGSFDYGPVKSMLELSYSDLPYDLKPCFLYLGIYLDDRLIDVTDLTRLWIGEGLLRPDLCNEGQTLEELGMDFVDELVQRCMVKVVHKHHDERAKAIQIHDLMRDLCIAKARELGFFSIAYDSTIPSSSTETLSRRAIFLGDGTSHLTYTSRLRSIIKMSGNSKIYSKLNIDYGDMKSLRVLHLAKADLGDSAQEIGNLTLLRYLHIEDCKGVTTKVLESVKRLVNLMTLVLQLGDAITIPNNMVCSMKQVRYLRLEGINQMWFEETLGVEGSRSLQCLHSDAGEWLSKELFVANLVLTLRILKLGRVNSQAQLDALYDFVGNRPNHLHSLLLQISKELEFDLQGMKLECCRHLEHLVLFGRIREQEKAFFFPPNLLVLRLVGSKIKKVDDLEGALTRLRELRSLKLGERAFDGDTLVMSRLLRLQKLRLQGLKNLSEWRIDEGSLPQLKELLILDCQKLTRLPEEIRHIKSLQRFHARAMPISFCRRLRRPKVKKHDDKGDRGYGEDFHLICHVPDIKIPMGFLDLLHRTREGRRSRSAQSIKEDKTPM